MKHILLFLLFLLGYSFFRFNLLDSTLVGHIQNIIGVTFVVFAIMLRKEKILERNEYKKYIYCFAFLPILGFLGAYIFHDQSFFDSIRAWIGTQSWWLMIPFLYKFKYSTKDIIKVIISFSVLYAVLSYAVAWIPQVAIFFARELSNGDFEMRNGIFRCRMAGNTCVVFSYIYFLLDFIKRRSRLSFLLLCMMAVSIYTLQTRQIFAAIGLITIIIILKNSHKNRWAIFLCLIGIFILANNYEILFGEFSEATQEDLYNDNYARYNSLEYFPKVITDNIISFFAGHGRYAPNTSYETFWVDMYTSRGIGPQDVGFIGAWYYYGIIYIFLFFKFEYRTIWKYRKRLPDWLCLFVLCTFLYSIFIFPFMDASPLWSCIFYMLNKELVPFYAIKTKNPEDLK